MTLFENGDQTILESHLLGGRWRDVIRDDIKVIYSPLQIWISEYFGSQQGSKSLLLIKRASYPFRHVCLNAVHLAAADFVMRNYDGEVTFVCFDIKLNRVSKALGMMAF